MPHAPRCLTRRFAHLLAHVGLWCASLCSSLAQVTEHPETIEPGKFRVELDGLRLSYDRADAAGNTYDTVAIGSTIVSAGLTSTLDLQLGVDFFLRHTADFGGVRDRQTGFGDISIRTKWTFLKDAHIGSFAIIPYVKLPSSTDGVGTPGVEGGVIFPWAIEFSSGLSAGAMFEWDMVRNDDDNGYDAYWFLSAYAMRSLTKSISLYGEATVEASSTGFSSRAASIGGGVLWQLTKSLCLDYEIQRGIGSRASAWTHTVRASWDW